MKFGSKLVDYIEQNGMVESISSFSLTYDLGRRGAHTFGNKKNYEKGGYAFY
jgi:hypothetical protein